MSDLNIDQDAAAYEAKASGKKIVCGQSTLLLLDLDTSEAWVAFKAMLRCVNQNLYSHHSVFIVKIRWWYSTNGNRHAIVYLSEAMPLVERLLLQAVLGSDAKRELLSLCRWYKGRNEPSMLFRPKGVKTYKLRSSLWETERSPTEDLDDLPF